MSIIDENIGSINELCIQHNVAKLFVFGSVLTDRFTNKSDIDFVVDFTNIDRYNYAQNYYMLKEALEDLLKRNIDLLEESAIKNPYLKSSIDSSKQLIYG